MRLIIHGGIHRTGTSTLQRFLAANRDALLKQGFLYPFEDISHRKISWSLHHDKLTGRALRDQLREAVGRGTHTVILSHEDFARLKRLAWLRPLKAEFEVKAAFYLRRQDLWVMSWYNQHVKWPFSRAKAALTPKEFLDTIGEYYWLDYHWLLTRWARLLGHENVLVGVLERSQVEDTVADFCERLGLDRTPLQPVAANSNESLPAHLLEFTRLLHIIDIPEARRARVIEGIRTINAGQDSGSAVYAPDVRNTIIGRFAKTNSAVAREFLDRPDGRLFLDDRVPADAPFVTPSLPDSYELVEKYVRPLIHHLTAAEQKRERIRAGRLRLP